MGSETRRIVAHENKILLSCPSLLGRIVMQRIQGEAQYDGLVVRRGRAESFLRPQIMLEVLEIDEIVLWMLVDCGMDPLWII